MGFCFTPWLQDTRKIICTAHVSSFRKGNVFTRVYLSVHLRSPCDRLRPVHTCSLRNTHLPSLAPATHGLESVQTYLIGDPPLSGTCWQAVGWPPTETSLCHTFRYTNYRLLWQMVRQKALWTKGLELSEINLINICRRTIIYDIKLLQWMWLTQRVWVCVRVMFVS